MRKITPKTDKKIIYFIIFINNSLFITIAPTNNEYISVRNATDFQLKKLEIDGNLGYDSRPSMSLKLRGPKQ